MLFRRQEFLVVALLILSTACQRRSDNAPTLSDAEVAQTITDLQLEVERLKSDVQTLSKAIQEKPTQGAPVATLDTAAPVETAVDVPAGHGALTLSSTPWALVQIDDGKADKTTPIKNLPLPIGRHRLVLTYPAKESGEIRCEMAVVIHDQMAVELAVDVEACAKGPGSSKNSP